MTFLKQSKQTNIFIYGNNNQDKKEINKLKK